MMSVKETRKSKFMKFKSYAAISVWEKKSYVLLVRHTRWRCNLQNGTEPETRLRQDLLAEIETLENYYKVLSSYLAGAEYDPAEIRGNLQIFKASLSRASAYLLTLYNLKGQRIKIPWEPLFTNLDHALATMDLAPSSKLRTTVQLALNMSEPKIEQVMSYLVNLKEFLK